MHEHFMGSPLEGTGGEERRLRKLFLQEIITDGRLVDHLVLVLDDWNQSIWSPLQKPCRLIFQIYIHHFMPMYTNITQILQFLTIDVAYAHHILLGDNPNGPTLDR